MDSGRNELMEFSRALKKVTKVQVKRVEKKHINKERTNGKNNNR